MQVRVCAHLYVILPAVSPAGRSQHLWPCHASGAPAQHQDHCPFVVASHTTSSPPISDQGVVEHAPEAQRQMPEARRNAHGGGTYRTWHIESQYFGGLLLGSAVSAALLRRHLMIWKMFVSRCMLDVIELLCMDDAALVGL